MPPTNTQCTLADLFDYNMNAFLKDNSIFCGRCRKRTGHYLTVEFVSNFIILEIIRASDTKTIGHFTKNRKPISFPTSGISVPGCTSKYQVVATCHHSGTLHAGHWFTKVKTTTQTGGNMMTLNRQIPLLIPWC